MKNSSRGKYIRITHKDIYKLTWTNGLLSRAKEREKTIGNDDVPHDLMQELLKVFERYRIDNNKEVVCLWRQKTGQLNCVMRPVEREQELIDRLKEWIELGN